MSSNRSHQWSEFYDLQDAVDQLPMPMPRRSSSAAKHRPSRQQTRQFDLLDSPREHECKAQPSWGAPMYDPVEAVRARVPFLSSAFNCSDDDAGLILSMLSTSAAPARGGCPDVEERLSVTMAEKKAVELRLEKRNEDVERLKDELADAKQKLRAVQQQATQSSQLLSQKREEIRKQLLLEEGRTQKLQHENKLLHQELDKLKSRVHQLMK